MTDREKVMQWLKTCANGCKDECPYEYKNLVYRVECKADLMSDALDLLREQEPQETRLVRHYSRPGVYADLWLHCEKCGGRIDDRYKPNYCPKCGRKVKWDA